MRRYRMHCCMKGMQLFCCKSLELLEILRV